MKDGGELRDRLHEAFDAQRPRPEAVDEVLHAVRTTAGQSRTPAVAAGASRLHSGRLLAGLGVAVLVVSASAGVLELSLHARSGSHLPSGPAPSATVPHPTAPSSILPGPQWWTTTACLAAITFTDQEHGWVATQTGPSTDAILATTDGGTSWTSQTTVSYQLTQLDFVNDVDGWSLGNPYANDSANPVHLLRTTDGGASWTVAAEADQPLACIDFVSPTLGYGLTDVGGLVTTADGGATWTTLSIGAGLSGAALCFDDGSRGWVAAGSVGAAGLGIYATDDGGAAWARQYAASWIDPISPTMGCSGETVWLGVFAKVGTAGLANEYIRTSDGGTDWTPPASPAPTPDVDDVWGTLDVVDAGTVEIGGFTHAGTSPLLETVTVGQAGSSRIQALPVGNLESLGMDGISFVDPLHGWAIVTGEPTGSETAGDVHGPEATSTADLLGAHRATLTAGGTTGVEELYSTSDGGYTWQYQARFAPSATAPSPAAST